MSSLGQRPERQVCFEIYKKIEFRIFKRKIFSFRSIQIFHPFNKGYPLQGPCLGHPCNNWPPCYLICSYFWPKIGSKYITFSVKIICICIIWEFGKLPSYLSLITYGHICGDNLTGENRKRMLDKIERLTSTFYMSVLADPVDKTWTLA